MSRVTEQYQRACQYLAGGVSASTRLNRAVGHAMLFDRAAGCRVWDLDGREYIDLCTSHGATLLGHGDPRVRRAVEAALARGAGCSYENEQHAELAELLCRTVPCLQRVRFTGSGTEATMHCLRLARAWTGRPRIVKFEGNFHGYHDQVMYAIGTPADQLGPEEAPARYPGSTGLPPGLEELMLVVPYNRPDLLEAVFSRHGAEVAAALAAVTAYTQPGFYEPIHAIAGKLYAGLNALFARHGVRAQVQGLGARFGIYFGVDGTPRSYRDVVHHQREEMLRFIRAAL